MAASDLEGLWVSPHLFPEVPTQAFPTKYLIWIERMFELFSKAYSVQRTFPCQALPCRHRWVFLMESCRTLCPVGSAALGTTQKNTTQREKYLEQQSGHFKCI